MERRTFVIGDVHGHYDRLEELLLKAGIIDEDGVRILGGDVIQLGDLGHFGDGGSPTGDRLCYEAVLEKYWVDIVLWGNHDRAQVDNKHAFTGFVRDFKTLELIKRLEAEGRLRMAHAAHGYLITHAGLHAAWKYQPGLPPALDKNDPDQVAAYINELPGKEDSNHAIYDASSPYRGGRNRVGGILWRDHQEKLYGGFPQIFGHTTNHKDHQVRQVGDNWNIDIGGKGNLSSERCLAGIWLPDLEIVRIGEEPKKQRRKQVRAT